MKKILLFGIMCLSTIASWAQLDMVKVSITDGMSDLGLRAKIESNASVLISSFNKTVIEGKSKPNLNLNCCTESAKKDILAMWKSSAISCPVSQVNEKCLTLSAGGYQIRNIAVTMMGAPLDKQEQEIVLNFAPDGRVDNVMVAIEENKYVDVIGANISVEDFARRQVIVDFVENFRTAYNRKDLAFLNTVFSNDALIITGKVIKIKPKSDAALQSLGSEKIVYQTQSKEKYLSGLKKCFSQTKYLNITFSDLEVVRHPRYDNIYGVTLKQDWKSSVYSDIGYVFLMIDFKDETQPCIQVRTWQPEQYNGHMLDRNEIFSLNSFKIK